MDIYLDGRTDVTIHTGASVVSVGVDDDEETLWGGERMEEMYAAEDGAVGLPAPGDADGNIADEQVDWSAEFADDTDGWYFSFPDDDPLAGFYVRLEGRRGDTWEAISAVLPMWQWQFSGEEFAEYCYGLPELTALGINP